MTLSADRGDRDWIRPMLLVAVLIHVLLFLIVLPETDLGQSAARPMQWVEIPPPASPDPTPSETTLPEEQPRLEPEPEPETQATADAPVTVPPDREPPDTDRPATEPVETPEPSPATPSAERLRELALIAARARAEPAAPASSGIEGSAAPRLPSSAGWLNDYVGAVTPQLDAWSMPDGSVGMRRVTESGQVYCGRADAPTVEQNFNPSLGMPIMRWRKCGRLRPDPIDRTDPWVRGQGRQQP